VFDTPDQVPAVIGTEMSFSVHAMEHIQHKVIDSKFRRGVASLVPKLRIAVALTHLVQYAW
jgi:hypothetical protein